MTPDPRIGEAAEKPILGVADRLGVKGLKRAGRELVGPCPACGGSDRFGINPVRNVYNCRSCGGGDTIALVRLVLACDFMAALDYLCGARDVQIDPAEQQRRKEKADAARAKRTADGERRRRDAIVAGCKIWDSSVSAKGTLVGDYLRKRGLPDQICDNPPANLRFVPDLPYMMPSKIGRGYDVVYRGPAMIAACRAPTGEVLAAHCTWIDPNAPKGKARIKNAAGDLILDPKGKPVVVKKVRGSKRACAIRFYNTPHFDTLVMGEGIETTLTALAARSYENAAYWAGIDLGHMSGRRIMGKGQKYAGIPDLDDMDAFVPPPWIKRLVFIQDGDSEPRSTRAKLLAGLRRAAAHIPHLKCQIVHPGEGVDLNDLLMTDVEV